jgi:hypothetical protein
MSKTRIAAALTGAAVLAITACTGNARVDSAGASHLAHSTAPAVTVFDPNGQSCDTTDSLGYCPGDDPSPSPSAPPCADQVKAWLAEQDGAGNGTVQHAIIGILTDARSFQQYSSSDPAGGQFFLSLLNDWVTYLTETSTPNAPPACADPQDLWGGDSLASGTFLGDASDASSDTSGTSQAVSDVQEVLGDFSALNAELAQNSGVTAKSAAPG